MRKILSSILLIGLLALFTGCNNVTPSPCDGTTLGGIYNISDFTVENEEFIELIEELTTPKKICQYMDENFEHVLTIFYCYNPCQMWTANKSGDCNDMATFATWVADYHDYETYQIHVFYKGQWVSHFLGVFVENGKMNYSSNTEYIELQTNSFKEIAEDNCTKYGKELQKYWVYDSNMNKIEEG